MHQKKKKFLGMSPCKIGWIENKRHNIQIKKLAYVIIEHIEKTTPLKHWGQLWIPLD